MPQNKKQHYVPKFYLKRFTPNERLINLYNLKSRRNIIGASLSSQCYKDYMYGKDGRCDAEISEWSPLKRCSAVTPKASQNLIRTSLPPAWKYFDPHSDGSDNYPGTGGRYKPLPM